MVRDHVYSRVVTKWGETGSIVNQKTKWTIRETRLLCTESSLLPIYEEQIKLEPKIYEFPSNDSLLFAIDVTNGGIKKLRSIHVDGKNRLMVRGTKTNRYNPEDGFRPRPRYRLRLHHGFVETVECSWDQYLTHCHAIAAEQPITRWKIHNSIPSSLGSGKYIWYLDTLPRPVDTGMVTGDTFLPKEVFDRLRQTISDLKISGININNIVIAIYQSPDENCLQGFVSASDDRDQALLSYAQSDPK